MNEVILSPTLMQTIVLSLVGFALSIIIYKLVLKYEKLGDFAFKDVFVILLPGYVLYLVLIAVSDRTNEISDTFVSITSLVIGFFVFYWMLKRYLPSITIQQSFKVYAIAEVLSAIIAFLVGLLLIAGNWDQIRDAATTADTGSGIDPEWVMRNRWLLVAGSLLVIIGLIVFNRKVSSRIDSRMANPFKFWKYFLIAFGVGMGIVALIILTTWLGY